MQQDFTSIISDLYLINKYVALDFASFLPLQILYLPSIIHLQTGFRIKVWVDIPIKGKNYSHVGNKIFPDWE